MKRAAKKGPAPKARTPLGALRALVRRNGLGAVLGALTDVCSEHVDVAVSEEGRPAEARPWARIACRLEELAIFAAEEEL